MLSPSNWRLRKNIRKLDQGRTERVLTYTDPTTGMVLRCVAVEFSDAPATE